ncbi:MAG TPA: 5-formyltetrahydrofolate cyclo-ligase [Rhodospirillaceae bacterium]|nr:5-formyltetrahydrofolate cyclo-ligase [Rhodospirillaceae bacterium]
MRMRRKTAALTQTDAATRLAEQFKTITLPANAICAGYIAVRDEIDPAEVMKFLSARGMQLSLPLVENENQPLEFREYSLGDTLSVDNPFQIPEPTADKNIVLPIVMLVPLLGFDRDGNRMGSGKGLYDRTIADLRQRQAVIAIGVGFAEQETPKIQPKDHDQTLNIIVTPREVIYCPQ